MPTMTQLTTLSEALDAGWTLTRKTLDGYTLKVWRGGEKLTAEAMRADWDCPLAVNVDGTVIDALVDLQRAIADVTAVEKQEAAT